MTSLTIIIPSSGRPSLRETLDSLAYQLRPGDKLVVDVNDDVPYGNAVRNRNLADVKTDAVLFQDDDDMFTSGALDVVRERYAEAPGRLHIFKMRYIENDFVLWTDKEVRVGNVASQMICAPGYPYPVGQFGDRYEGDHDFVHSTVSLLGEPVWNEEIISLVHHPLLKGVKHAPA